MNAGITLMLAIILTAIWITLMIVAEPIKDTYRKYVKPDIRFVPTQDGESGYFHREGNVRKLVGVIVHFQGFFENGGGIPSTVKRLELQLIRKRWIFKRVISRKTANTVFRESQSPDLVDKRGYYVPEYYSSPFVDITGSCVCGDKCPQVFDKSYFLRVRWIVLGQPIKNLDITVDWDIFNERIKHHLSQPIADTPDSENQ